MSRVVLRLGRRRTSWEAGTAVDDVLRAEFSPKGALDLRPSVYVLDVPPSALHAEVVRVHAQHAVSLLSAPPNGMVNVDLEAATDAEVRASPGATKFAHANGLHAEVMLAGEDALRELVTQVHATLGSRTHPVTRDELLDKALGGSDTGDTEWQKALSEPPGEDWAGLLRKRRNAR